jgi:glyoxylase-like metal-dependent hydrolase (beta-lactamase superfamily II)
MMTVAVTRRTFLVHAGRGTIALAVLGVAGCVPAGAGSSAPSAAATDPATGSPATEPSATDPPATDPASAAPVDEGVAWERVDLGFVSAYVLVRGGEAAVVDTGVPGSDDDIATALERLGLGWGAVGHVVLTHQHDDHAGSAAAVLTAAPAATGYAGEADIPAIAVPRSLVAVSDGDTVFGLRIVATPGHTAGHVAVFDEAGGVLVAGDALNTSDGNVTGPNPSFSSDMTTAMASVAKLGALRFETLLVGHGEPITSGASAQVAALAAGS